MSAPDTAPPTVNVARHEVGEAVADVLGRWTGSDGYHGYHGRRGRAYVELSNGLRLIVEVAVWEGTPEDAQRAGWQVGPWDTR